MINYRNAWLLVALLVTLGLGSICFADSLEEGKAAYVIGDYKTALKLIRPLANQGNAEAALLLAAMSLEGLGVPKDLAEALKWTRKAAEQGDASAQFNLGGMYHEGLGVPQDYVEALNWTRKAAEQGHNMAQSQLGAMYEMGRGCSRDYVLSHMWFNLASTSGYTAAASARDRIAKKMTPEQIAQAQKMAGEWKAKK